MAVILIWENDPASGVLVYAPKPSIGSLPFKYTFPPPPMNTSQSSTSPEFRYWNAASALRRGADFWGPKVVNQQWFRGPALGVRLDVGLRWNADYDRQALNFYHGVSTGATIYASSSPDMLCHELGHAMLDAINKHLWHTASLEVDAFHESFADMSAILCSLQIPSMRDSILAETGGNLYRNSRLSKIAEQFGTALHVLYPNDAESDCLRNAMNPFCYSDPDTLQPSAPATQLSSDRHSFSRIFTGALFEVMAGMLALYPSPPTSDQLLAVTIEMRDIMVAAVESAGIVTSYYAEIASEMIQKSAAKNAAYPGIFTAAFVRRSILSLESAAAIMALVTAAGGAVIAHEEVDQTSEPEFSRIPSPHYGPDEYLYVEMPLDPADSIARSADTDGRSLEPVSPIAAATSFVDQLFIKGLVNYGEFADKDHKGDKDNTDLALAHTTHRLQREGDEIRLIRIRINCGAKYVCSAS